MSEITLTKALENLCSVPFEMQVTAYLKRNPGVPKVDAERIIEERDALRKAAEEGRLRGEEFKLREKAQEEGRTEEGKRG